MARFNRKNQNKMNKSMKSQLAMLMIIGLALFIVVSFVMYLSKLAIKKQSQQNIKNVQETAIDTQPIKEFVTKCLDKLTKDGILLLGQQGGYIYKSQGGTLVDYSATDQGITFINFNNKRVSYNIKRLQPYQNYPSELFPYTSSDLIEVSFTGYILGFTNLPDLNASGRPNSIQSQIETFVENNLAACTDFNIFKKQGYDIAAGTPKATLIIGSQDLKSVLELPITIINPSTRELTHIRDFSTTMNVRLGEIYFFVNSLIKNDNEDFKFNISDIDNNQNYFKVQTIGSAFVGSKTDDDLIIVTDEKSLIYGQPLQYIFGRKNRAPALHYIKNNFLEFESGHSIKEEELIGNPSILKGEDPDEDSLKFNIYIGEFGNTLAQFPVTLDKPQIKFRVEVSDEKLSDNQIITVNCNNC